LTLDQPIDKGSAAQLQRDALARGARSHCTTIVLMYEHMPAALEGGVKARPDAATAPAGRCQRIPHNTYAVELWGVFGTLTKH
jgi:hypothetical protein